MCDVIVFGETKTDNAQTKKLDVRFCGCFFVLVRVMRLLVVGFLAEVWICEDLDLAKV
jgi:hypothetical protein